MDELRFLIQWLLTEVSSDAQSYLIEMLDLLTFYSSSELIEKLKRQFWTCSYQGL